MKHENLARREALRRLSAIAAGILLPAPLAACQESGSQVQVLDAPARDTAETSRVGMQPADEARLESWVATLRQEGLDDTTVPLGIAAVRVGELAIGTPYEPYTLEAYIRAGGSPSRSEPLTLSLTRFDCVSLVESCLAAARIARSGSPASWEDFARAMERMRYRDGVRQAYSSRLHYFSEWIDDNRQRGLVSVLGEELGGVLDQRELRFMSSNPTSYDALADESVFRQIVEMERNLDGHPRWLVPKVRIPAIVPRLRSGDILAFGTSIEGLDVTHAAFAYRSDDDVCRVLHAPLSGGVVEITQSTVPEYVNAISRATGILVARPLDG